jgi:transcriptional regulator with XRE-family HTH domain
VTPAASLKALRLRAGLTQEELAKKAGLDRPWVNQMERGNRPITASPAEKLAAALGVSPAELGAEAQSLEPEYRSLHQRLEELEAAFAAEQRSRERAGRAIVERLAGLEEALGLQARRPTRRGRGR